MRLCGRFRRGLRTLVLPLLLATPALYAADMTASPEDYRQAVQRLGPGDTLRLRPGVYTDGLRLHGLSGVPGGRITIVGPEPGGDPAIFLGQRGRNTVSLSNVAYLTLRNLTLDGRGEPVDAVKAEGTSDFAHHVTLEGLTIRGHDNHQQNVGISTKCPAWDWVIRDSVIDGAGTGIYLGDSDGSAPFIGGVIEGNVVKNTIGYNLQIKYQKPRPSVDGMPTAPRFTILRHNTFSKSNGGATGNMARPNVLLGDFPPSGAGEFDRYLVYGNFFYQNATEALFQGSGRLALYNNLFVNTTPEGMAIRLTPHNGQLRYFEVFHNTIIAAGRGIGAWDPEPDGRRWVGANAIFAARPLDGDYQADWNVLGDMADAPDYLVAPLASLPQMDLHPRGERLADTDIHDGPLVGYPDAALDFDGRRRDKGYAGAYVGPGRPGAWSPSESRAPPWARERDVARADGVD